MYWSGDRVTAIVQDTDLSEVIRGKIREEGPVSFRDFMEMSLYYPELGYYNSPKQKIGPNGDFYTSSNLGPVFGAMIGKQLDEMWHLTGAGDFTVVEYGAGTGALCHDILDYLHVNSELYNHLHYAIIEKSDVMCNVERSHLHQKVGWYNDIKELGSITGCILSNELLDNFAVHQVVMEDELMEVFVDYDDGFTEVLKPAGNGLIEYLAGLNVTLPPGFRTEINIEATEWIETIAKSLDKGYVMTIDYGDTSANLYKPCRSQGTLLCYYQHQLNDNPYCNVGKQDITAHVNFSALCHWGNKFGLACCGLTSQAHFLLALGFKDYLRSTAARQGDVVKLAMEEVRLTRMLLVEMGSKFKVLIQQKGMPDTALIGLRLA